MSQNEKRLFDRHKKQKELPLEQTQAVPAVQDEITAEPAAEASPKRNKYADKMNRKKRRLSKGARIGITAAAVALLLGGGIWAVVKSRDAGTEDVTQTTAMVSCGDLETYIEGSGVTAAKKREELGREVKGKVTQVLVAEGDEVHTGDPLLVIDQYGADALRFTLATGNAPGNDMRFSDEKVKASRNFANKLWNAARFVLMYLGNDYSYPGLPKDLAIEDKWILSKVNTLAKEVTDNLERFELGIAVAKLYDFIWDVFCDWYIEIAKIRLQSGEGADTAKAVLVYVLTDILKLLHPFMPFITEEIYQAIPHDTESIMISKWPEYDPTLSFADEEAQMEKIMDAIRAIRNRRAEMNIPPSKKSKVYVETAFSDVFAVGSEFIKRLAYASDVEIADAFGDLGNTVTIVTNDAKIYIPLGDLVDFEAEAKRLQKELAAAEEKLAFINKKLDNPGFVNKAPEKVVQQNRDEAAKLTEKIANLRSSLENLGK